MSLQDIVVFANSVTKAITSSVVIPILIFFSGVILGRVLFVLLFSFLRSVEFDKHARKTFRHRAEYSELVSGGVAAIIYTVGTVWALVEAGIIVFVLQIVGAFLGFLALLALVVWLIDLLPNLFAYYAVVKKWSVGDDISVSGVSGTVQSFGWLSVTVLSNGYTVVIPHRTVKQS